MEYLAGAPGGAIRKEKSERVDTTSRTAAANAAQVAAASDAELIACVLQREEAALGTIYDRYGRLVYSVALRITGDRQSAEEVVQDVFQAVWLGAGGFQPGGSLAAWLVGIARHRAIDLTRARRFRARAREEALDDQRLVRSASVAEAPVDSLLLRQTVRLALGELPLPQRQVVELAFYGGLSCREIALRLDEPVGTVKSRLRLGLIKLRDLLNAVEE
jgi:RNA polymerase sigma-70 factor (ECF subfamily)